MHDAEDQHLLVTRARYERERKARQDAERLLEEKSRQLIEAEKQRSSFLVMLSHELKTPLNGVVGAAQILDGLIAGLAHAHVDTILQSSTSLNAQIDSLLTLAELYAGDISIENEPVLVPELLEQVGEALRPMALVKDITLRITCDKELQRPVLSDRKRLRQILTALVSNAVKTTPSGIVGIAARRSEEGISVLVSSSGAVAEQKTKSFGRPAPDRYAGHTPYDDAEVTMPILRETVALLGGEIITSESLLGGTCFTVVLPVEFCALAHEVPKGTPASRNRPMRVLLVDDNKINRMMAHHAVTSANMSCIEAVNGAEALERLDEDEFDLVLMDIQMPVMTGDEAIRRIRMMQAPYRDIPIIVVTAHAGREGPDSFRDIGADYTLEKPILFSRLISCIEEVTKKPVAA